jgi:hypothetical protein
MRMRTSWTAAGCAITVALLALAPRTAAAQFNNPFDRNDAPFLVQNFTGGTVRSLEHEFQADLYVLGAFDGRRSVDRFQRSELERAQPWKLYGRLGPMHFQNMLEPQASRLQYTQGLQFSWRRTGPSLGGRVYVGIHRTF